MTEAIRRLLTAAGIATAHPAAFLIVLVYAVAWVTLGHIDWHGAATLATWIMTLFIQRAEHRDTQAIHAKLDELLKAERHAHPELTHLDDRQPEDIERYRDAQRGNR